MQVFFGAQCWNARRRFAEFAALHRTLRGRRLMRSSFFSPSRRRSSSNSNEEETILPYTNGLRTEQRCRPVPALPPTRTAVSTDELEARRRDLAVYVAVRVWDRFECPVAKEGGIFLQI